MRLSLRNTKVDAHEDSLWSASWTAGPDLLVCGRRFNVQGNMDVGAPITRILCQVNGECGKYNIVFMVHYRQHRADGDAAKQRHSSYVQSLFFFLMYLLRPCFLNTPVVLTIFTCISVIII